MIVQPPEIIPVGETSIFLAGTIDNGASRDWQQEFSEYFSKNGATVFNPRRKDWDSDLKPVLENEDFKKQVSWEISYLEKVDTVVFNFLPNSKSPISLLELGLVANSAQYVYVICPKEFYRRGNVEYICDKFGIKLFESEPEFFETFDRYFEVSK